MSQYTINIGAIPNDGTGDPLRTAFNETNLNFNQIWATGLIGSNIAVANNTILTTNTNGNLVLAPNGIGQVVANVNIVPNLTLVRNLGSSTRRWGTVYAQYGDITAFLGNLSVPAVITNSISSDDSTFVTIADGLNVDGDIETHGNITADYFIGNGSQLTGITGGGIQSSIANGTSNVNIAASGGNITMGANGNAGIVTVTGTGANITGTANVSGNISGNYFIGNGSQLTGLAATYGNSNVATFLATFGSNTVSTTGNVSAGYLFGNGSTLTGIAASYGNANVVANLAALGSNPISTTGNVTGGNILFGSGIVSGTGNITGNYFVGNGSLLTSLTGANVTGTVANATSATTAATVTSNAQANITSVGTLTSLSSSGNVTGGNILTGGIVSATGNATAGNVLTAGLISATSNITGGNILTGGLISASGNISANNLSLAGNITSNIGFTGATITINNAPGGNEGAEVIWALPSPANTVLSTSLVQDVYQNGMRFFESGGNSRGLYMDLGNVPNGSATAVGYRDIPQVAFTANTTITTTDAGKHYYSTLSTGNVLTIANNASQGFQVGAAISIVNQGTGNITVAQGSGVTLYFAGNATSGNRTVVTFGMATLIKVATNTWFINGTGVS